jgi:hypothetical protein
MLQEKKAKVSFCKQIDTANQLCQRWTSWMEGQTYCYKLTCQGDTVQWFRNDGRSGTARIGEGD